MVSPNAESVSFCHDCNTAEIKVSQYWIYTFSRGLEEMYFIIPEASKWKKKYEPKHLSIYLNVTVQVKKWAVPLLCQEFRQHTRWVRQNDSTASDRDCCNNKTVELKQHLVKVRAGAVFTIPGSSAQLEIGTELSAAVKLQVSSDSIAWPVVT